MVPRKENAKRRKQAKRGMTDQDGCPEFVCEEA